VHPCHLCRSVKRKVSTRTDDEPAMLPPAPGGREAIELPNVLVLANESFQEESGAEETMSQEDDHDKLEDADYVECKSDGTTSKKRKAPRKLKSPRLVLSSNIVTATKLR